MSKKTNILIENAFKKNLSEFETNFKRLMKEKVALTVRKTLFEDTHVVNDEDDISVEVEEEDDDVELDVKDRLEESEDEDNNRLEEEDEEEDDEDENVISEMIQKLIKTRLSEKFDDEDEDVLSEDEENENVETGTGPDSNDIEAMEDLE